MQEAGPELHRRGIKLGGGALVVWVEHGARASARGHGMQEAGPELHGRGMRAGRWGLIPGWRHACCSLGRLPRYLSFRRDNNELLLFILKQLVAESR